MTIINVEVLVAEEDYKYSIRDDWDEHKEQILKDVNDPEESFIWREQWLAEKGPNQYMDWDIHSLVGREVRVMGHEVVCK